MWYGTSISFDKMWKPQSLGGVRGQGLSGYFQVSEIVLELLVVQLQLKRQYASFRVDFYAIC